MLNTPQLVKDLRVVNTLVAKYDASKDATGKVIGTLPKHAIPLRTVAHVTTAFNGTTPTIDVGYTGDTDALGATAAILPAAAGIKSAPPTAAGPLTEDKDIIVTEGGTTVTTGVVHLVVEYVFPFDYATFGA